MQHQYRFALRVARYLEDNDSSLSPIPHLKPLYPVLPTTQSDGLLEHHNATSGSANRSDYDDWIQQERNEDPFQTLQNETPSAPSLQEIPSENPQFAKTGIEYATKSGKHDRPAPRIVETFVATPSLWSNSDRIIVVNNNTPVQKKEEKDTEESKTKSPLAAAAVIAGVSVGATVVGARLLLAQKTLQNLCDEAKTIERDRETSDFLDQFHKTFGILRTRNRTYSASGATATVAALTASSLYYFNYKSDFAYFCLLGLGCVSMCATSFAHIWYNNELVGETHKLHSMCKNLCEKAQ